MVPSLLRVRNAFAQAEGDAAILEAAVGLEQTAVVAYDTAVKSGLLEKPVERVARLFRDQEQAHAAALTTALEGLGGRAPARPEPSSITGLGGVRNQADITNFAVELETMAVAAYYEAHGKLKDRKLLETAAQIMANEGQHLAVLRPLVEKPAVPDAFETGEST